MLQYCGQYMKEYEGILYYIFLLTYVFVNAVIVLLVLIMHHMLQYVVCRYDRCPGTMLLI